MVSWNKVRFTFFFFLPQFSLCVYWIFLKGGLVEISTKRGESSVPTRTIGDPSTGTDLSEPPKDDPSPAATPADRLSCKDQSMETIKPQRVQLPEPQRFSIEDLDMDEGRDEFVDDLPGSMEGNGRESVMLSSSLISQQSNISSPSHLSNDSQLHSTIPPSPTTTTTTTTASTSTTPTTAAANSSSTIVCEPGMRVLVVDDDPLTRKLMTRMLTRLGCRVSTAENGEIALEKILGGGSGGGSGGNHPTPSSEDTGSGGLMEVPVQVSLTMSNSTAMMGDEEVKYGVVFLDNQMPKVSGLEVVSRLRGMGRSDFVVGVTGEFLLLFKIK